MEEKLKLKIKLAHKSDDPLYTQDIELLEFFLNTDKPVVSVDDVVFESAKHLLEDYPTWKCRETSTIIAKDMPTLRLYKEAYSYLEGEARWFTLGHLYGFPPRAIYDFIEGIAPEDKTEINYFGLIFVCHEKNYIEVSKQLRTMYDDFL